MGRSAIPLPLDVYSWATILPIQPVAPMMPFAGVLGRYVQKVVYNAYGVTDDDITLLCKHCYTTDQIFEATVSAALRAGLLRLDAGLTALQAEKLLSSYT
jgi:hypothetical protein